MPKQWRTANYCGTQVDIMASSLTCDASADYEAAMANDEPPKGFISRLRAYHCDEENPKDLARKQSKALHG